MSLRKKNGVVVDDGDDNEAGGGGGGRWENLPQELLWDIIKRVEETETYWPARVILSCASVCKSWRAITKEIVKSPQLSGRLTFPISLKQPGPRDSATQCYIKRRDTSIYLLYLGPEPSEDKNDKLLLAAKRKQRIRNTKFVISLVAHDFRRTSKAYVGKVRSNFLDYKFTIYDTHPPQHYHEAAGEVANETKNRRQSNHRRSQSNNKVSLRRYNVGTVTYKINMIHKCRFHRIKGPRKMSCDIMMMNNNSIDLQKLRSKDPMWDEECQRWHLNFRHHDTLASDNFQLVSAATVAGDEQEHKHGHKHEQQREKVILEFAKIAEDVFIMDYCYPLSAFQAFAICLSNFDAKPTCD